MNLFLSKYINNIDKKNRLSVPISYREILSQKSFNGFIGYPSFRNKCIEACSIDRLTELSEIIQNLDPYSQERDAFETLIMGESIQFPIDNEGRIVLSRSLMKHAEIDIEQDSKVCFVGKGLIFELWNPTNFEDHLKEVRKIAMNNCLILKNI